MQNNMYRILLLEDDVVLSKEISSYLIQKELLCDTVFDGELFFRMIKNEPYDTYLLDINVPKINGLDACAAVREYDRKTPILMLTALGEIEDKIEAFKRGADDYLVKPFHLEELYIRIDALCRRKSKIQAIDQVITVDDLVINLNDKSIQRNGNIINLTPKEFKLLHILAQANGRVLSKLQISQSLWDYHIETSQNTIEVYINFLRNKIDKNQETKLIHTKVGFGYYLKVE